MKKNQDLNSSLFNERVDQKEMSQAYGGQTTAQTIRTYVTTNTDSGTCGGDYSDTSYAIAKLAPNGGLS